MTGIVVGRIWQAWNDYEWADQEKLQEIAKRLGVDEDWEAVTKHVYCKMLQPGLTKLEVEAQLAKIGPYSLGNPDISVERVYVHFGDRITNNHLRVMSLWFDDNGKVVGAGRSTILGDPNPVNCP